MESRSPRATAVFRQQDLEALAGIAMMRLPLRAPEYRRLQRMRALLDAATELTRRLGSHTHAMLVNCGGTHGVGDLRAETSALFDALEAYTTLVHDVTAEYESLLAESAPDLELLAAAGRSVQLQAV